jgi:hypothetical protein
MKTRGTFGRVHPAIVAVWAAIIAVAWLLPTFPLVGGGNFTVGKVLIPLAGVFFGPWAGMLCAAIGSFIGQIYVPGPPFAGVFYFTIQAVGALVSGLVMRRNWLWPVAIIVVLGAAWYASPLGRASWFMPPVYLLGVVAAILGAIWGSHWLAGEDKAKMFAGVFMASLAGIVASQAMGNLMWLVMAGPPPAQVIALTFLGPLERIIFAVAAAIVGVPLLTALPRVGVLVGPALYEEEEEDQ